MPKLTPTPFPVILWFFLTLWLFPAFSFFLISWAVPALSFFPALWLFLIPGAVPCPFSLSCPFTVPYSFSFSAGRFLPQCKLWQERRGLSTSPPREDSGPHSGCCHLMQEHLPPVRHSPPGFSQSFLPDLLPLHRYP